MTTAGRAGLGRSARVISLVGLAHMMSHVYQLCLPPLFPLMAADLGVGYTALGLLLTVFSVASACGQVPFGFIVDRIGGRAVLISGLVVQAGAVALIGFSHSYWALLALFAVAGVAHAVYHPADYAILSRALPEERLGRAYTLHSASGNFGTAIAPMAMVSLAALWDWHAACLAIGLFGVAYALLLLPLGDALEGAGPARQAARARRSGIGAAAAGNWRSGVALLASPPILLCFLFFVVLNTAFAGIRSFAPSAIIEMYHVPLATANGALTGFILGATAGILAGGVLADRIGAKAVTAVIGLIGAAALLFVVANVSVTVAVLVALLTAAGFLRGLVQGTRDLMVYSATPPGDLGKVFAFMSTGGQVGTAVMPLVFGWIIDAGRPDLAFQIAGALALAAVATFVTVRRSVAAGS